MTNWKQRKYNFIEKKEKYAQIYVLYLLVRVKTSPIKARRKFNA